MKKLRVLLALCGAALMLVAAPSARADLVSRFDAGPEGWGRTADGVYPPPPAPWDPGGYLSSTADGAGFVEQFQSPDSWRGDRSGALGRRLIFDLRAEVVAPGLPIPFVYITGGGGWLEYRTRPTASPDWQHFELPIDEGAGWFNQAGQPATRADIQSRLSQLASITITAEFDTNAGTTWLDNVVLEVPDPAPKPVADLSVRVAGPSSMRLSMTPQTSTVTVTNGGPDRRWCHRRDRATESGEARVTPPRGVTCVTSTPIVCRVPTLMAGASATFSVQWPARGDLGAHTLRATVTSSSTSNPSAANNVASMAVTFLDPSGRAPLPPPQVGKTMNLVPISGKVLVRVPGTKKFRELKAGEQLPVGTGVDLTKGRIALTAATDAAGHTEKSQFYGGTFVLAQAKGAAPIPELRLDRVTGCGKAAAAGGTKKKKTNALWGDGKGKFRTRGRYGSAAVRGTKWLTREQCGGTFVKVAQGTVLVRDFGRGRNVLVRAPRSYLAKAKRR